MNPIRTGAGLAVLLLGLRTLLAAEPTLDKDPVLRLEAGGPTAFVTSLAFSPNGQALYAAGYDKVLHSWALDADRKFVPSTDTYRVPIGPGIDGVINSVAVSSDGNWLAMAGRAPMRGATGMHRPGVWVPTVRVFSDLMWEDQGTISLFNTRTGAVQPLRGHRGQVVSLAFAPVRAGEPVLLASVARERQGNGYVGAARLWDVAKGKEIRRLLTLPDLVTPQRTLQPRLALWRAGAKVRVALAWDDGNFRVWDLSSDQDQLREKVDGGFNNTVAALPSQDQVLTASFNEGKGRLRLWKLAGAEGLEVVRQAILPAGHRPRALTLIAAKGIGPPDRAAVVVEAREKEYQYLLCLFDLEGLKRIREPLLLWSGPRELPSLTASADSRFLAVAGRKDHSVHVLAMADLLQGQDGRQRLRGAGVAVRSAGFVKKGPSLGLLLSEQPRADLGKVQAAPQEGDLVFDLGARLLRTNLAGWKSDRAPTDGWDAVSSVDKDDQGRIVGRTLVVRQDGTKVATVRLQPTQFVTDYALLAPRPPLDVPLLAVAFLDLGQPVLRLYNGKTGEHVRQLTGHVNRIHALAFSSDGRLLVSAAEDQITSVWSLTTLDKFLGHKGRLHGLAFVEQEKRGLVLAQIDDATLLPANRKKLTAAGVKEDDGLDGLVFKGKLRRVATNQEYFDAIHELKPGQTVTLRLRGRGDVALTVGQAINDEQPLLSLFVTQVGAARHWIGWSPVGPYDFSDRAAERMLGWHQNTGDTRKPATAAPANQYRDTYYRPDILKYLTAHGSVGPALDAWKKDHPDKVREPKLSLWFRELGPQPPADERGRVRIGQRKLTLALAVQDLPADRIESVRWQIDGGEGGKFEPASGEWSADLSDFAWKRGEHRVRAIVRTTEDGQEYPRELVVLYQPPRPVVKARVVHPRVVDKPEFNLQAEVVPAGGQTVRVSLAHRHNGKDVAVEKPWDVKEATKIDKALKLKPGTNQIKLLARNEGAGDDDAEADWLTVEVLYEKAPQITLTAIEPLPNGTAVRLDPSRLDKPTVVDVPKVRIVGEIEALEKLTAASWAQGEPDKDEKRTPLPLGKDNRLVIAQEVTLPKVGQAVKFRFYARTAAGPETERSVTLEYQPRLPELVLTAPVEGQPLFQGQDALTVRVEGRLLWPATRHACVAQVLVNGKEQGKAVALAAEAKTFAASAELQPGENRIQVRLKNDWREMTAPKLLVSYRQPPRVLSLKAPGKAIKPFGELVALVETPKALPLTLLKINGAERAAADLKPTVDRQEGDVVVYRIDLKELPLRSGKNAITLEAANRDGWSLKPVAAEITFEMAAPPRAQVSLLNPARDAVVEAPDFEVEFRVRSESPLKKVELQRNGRAAYAKTDLAGVTKNADGYYEVRETRGVRLQEGLNAMKVVAQNAGGEQSSAAVVLTYQTGPVRLSIDHLELGRKDLEPLSIAGDGTLLFPEIDQGQATLHGQVEWGPQNDAQVAKVQSVRVCVNGSQQLPATLERPTGGSRLRKFRAVVRLTRPKGNQVTVRLPDVPQDAGSRDRCLMDCSRVAETRRQAHLLIVDTSKDEAGAVTNRVLQALQAKPAGPDRFTKPGFADGGLVYGPLLGDEVASERVGLQLLTIKTNLQLRAAAGAVDDVVLLYFRTGESIDGQGHFFRPAGDASSPRRRSQGTSCDMLMRFCADNPGAQVVLLDVTREGEANPTQDLVPRWSEDPNVAVLRYSWKGPPQEQDADARLIADWRDALAKTTQLGEAVAMVSNRFTKVTSRKYPERLSYSQQLPSTLRDFALGLARP
jgi:WD40 repeat protein